MNIDYTFVLSELNMLQWCSEDVEITDNEIRYETWMMGYYDGQRVLCINPDDNSFIIDAKLVYDIKHAYLHDHHEIILEPDVKTVIFSTTQLWFDAGGKMVETLKKVIELCIRLIKLNYIRQNKEEIYAESEIQIN